MFQIHVHLTVLSGHILRSRRIRQLGSFGGIDTTYSFDMTEITEGSGSGWSNLGIVLPGCLIRMRGRREFRI